VIKITELAERVSVTLENKSNQLEIIHCVDKLARNFVGSNNANYVDSYGDPGTRRQGGEDAATDQAYTTIIPALTRVIFAVRVQAQLGELSTTCGVHTCSACDSC
jgi:DNA topoisomerase-2